jgi:hypothetical protein
MISNRKLIALSLFIIASLPLWGGTGSPRDGLLSFILLFGFLVLLLGILQLASYLKRKIQELLEDIY